MTKIIIDITTCQSCPYFKKGPRESTDGFDSGYDWFCGAKSNKRIQGFVEWHEEDNIAIPDWCPKQASPAVLKKLDKDADFASSLKA